MAKAKGAPVEEMQVCAGRCAGWLLRHGFFTNPFDDGYGPTLPPPDVITRLLPSVDDDGQEKARAVRGVLVWLDWHVLPAVDGRREADGRRLRDMPPSDTVPDPLARAELIYGTAEELLAAQVRSIVASQAALEAGVSKVVARQIERARIAGQPPPELARWYRRWLADGEEVLGQLLSRGPTGQRLPRTVSDWAASRTFLEGELRALEFTSAEVMELLPGGGSKAALKARQSRHKRSSAGR